MDERTLVLELNKHDEMLVDCVRGQLGVEDFFAAYDAFYPRLPLDGHEDTLSPDLILRYSERIRVHERVWLEVESKRTSEEHAAVDEYREHGFIGADEARSRLESIAEQGGLLRASPGAE